MTITLPTPPAEAIDHSQAVIEGLRREYFSQQNIIPFSDYMNYVLYQPGLGYYASGHQKFGDRGDFITAPELSPLFGRCLANQCQQVLSELPKSSIIEFGAGSGKLASEILLTLEKQQCLPTQYYILEVSSELQRRQQETLKQACPHLLASVSWLNQLPQEPINAIVIANEVFDAMPATVFSIEDDVLFEKGVGLQEGQLCWKNITNPILEETVKPLFQQWPKRYQSELNQWIDPWMHSLQHCIRRGVVLIIDYGFTGAEYYHPQRSQGTLMCHYRHHAHDNPFYYPGVQDITAHVDFTHIAIAASQHQWQVAGFCNQAHFLLGCGLVELDKADDFLSQTVYNQHIKKLTHPHEMGELFKVMVLTKQYETPLMGCALQDWRRKL